MAENYYYVLNTGKTQSQALNYTYAQRGDPFPTIAFYETPVNPIIKNPGIPSSGNFAGVNNVSANFFEIRKAPFDLNSSGVVVNSEPMISGNLDTGLVNRIHPAGYSDTATDPNHITQHASNLQDTSSNRIRLKDSVSGTSAVGSAGLGMDLETYDYFILINPEITGNDGTVSIRPHFAKVTKIIQFDNHGDGIEFSPRYSDSIPKDTKFELYVGPHVNNTNVVAVSYGLRGNSSSSSSIISDKYDVSNVVSRPTWYFYEDRLDEKDQLNYNTKYQLTSCRFYKNWTSFGGTASQTSDGIYHSTSTISTTVLSNTSYQGHTIWAEVSGVKRNLGNLVTAHANSPTLDDVKFDIPTATEVTGGATAPTLYYGRDVVQSVFLTEPDFGTIITDVGPKNLDATLVDNIKEKDRTKYDYDTNSTFTPDPSAWSMIVRNAQRNSNDRMSTHSSWSNNTNYTHVHADLNGPVRHLHYKDAHLKNNVLTSVIDTSVNYPRNKATQVARVKTLDQSGVQFLKMKERDKFRIRNSIFSGQLGEYKLPYTVTSNSASGYKIILNQILEGFDCRNDSMIKTTDSIRVGTNYYIISSIAAPDTSARTQTLTVNKVRSGTDATYSNMTSMESFDKADAYLFSWNGALVSNTPIDTEVIYASNNFKRLTMNGNTVSKESTTIYNNKLVLLSGEFIGLDIPIDYGDSQHKYLKLQDANKEFYIPTGTAAVNKPSFMHYVSGGYAVDEEIFSGHVEDSLSKNERGLVTYEITGRDKMAKLLNNTVNKNLNYSNDIIYSSLNPMFNVSETISIAVSGIFLTGATTFTSTDASNLAKYDLIFRVDMTFVGEVESVSGNTVTLRDKALASNGSSGTSVKAISLTNATSNKFIQSLTKAIAVNPLATSNATDLVSASDKGLVFIDGEELTYDANRNQSTVSLPYTSATGKYREDTSLGYHISGVKSLKSKDSKFAFKLGNEDTPTPTESSKLIPSSHNYYSIVNKTEKEGEATTLTLAPTMTVVLASVETNSSDTRFTDSNSYLYFLNNNIPKAGFLHRLRSKHEGYNYTSSAIFKYQDLQTFTPGSLTQTSAGSIYNDLGNISVSGAAPSYNIRPDGASLAPTLTNNTDPIEGSNIVDSDYNAHYQSVIGNYLYKLSDNTALVPPKSQVRGLVLEETVNYGNVQINTWGTAGGLAAITFDSVSNLQNKDIRVKNYELMALGDIYPESKLRHNHLGFSSKSMSTYGMLLESPAQEGDAVNHANYVGSSSELLMKESNYQTGQISSSSINTDGIKRWGVMRLVEATYDWHFNPVDAENMPATSKIPEIPNFDYQRFKTPTEPDTSNVTFCDVDYDEGTIQFKTSTAASGNNKSITVQPNDMLYSAASGHLLAVYKGTSAVTLHGSSDSGNWTSGDWLLLNEGTNAKVYILRQEYKVSGTSPTTTLHQLPGLMPFNLYATTNDGFDNLAENPIKFTNVILAREPIDKGYFDYSILEGDSNNILDPQNVFIPLVSGVKRNHDDTDKKYYTISAFHDTEQWENLRANWNSFTPPNYHHTSRVLSALCLETFDSGADETNQANKVQNFLMGTGHLYDNCTAVFKDIKNSFSGQNYDLSVVSAPLDCPTNAEYNAYDDHPANSENDQHGPNIMIKRKGKNAAFVGTRTKQRILVDEEGRESPSRASHHQANQADSGEMFSAQMFVKPGFNLTGLSTNTLGTLGVQRNSTSDQLTFQMNDASTHNWLSFANNLEGYYIVSNKTENGQLPNGIETTLNEGSLTASDTTITLTSTAHLPSSGTIKMHGYFTYSSSTKTNEWEIITYTGINGNNLTGCTRNADDRTQDSGNGTFNITWVHPNGSAVVLISGSDKTGAPTYIGRITSHAVSAGTDAGSGSDSRSQHILTLDNAINITTHGTSYRLMRIAEKTFDETPDYIDLNTMFDTGLQYDVETSNLLTGDTGIANAYSENIYSMYIPLDIDTADSGNSNKAFNYIDRRDIDNTISLFTSGQTYDCYVTDGNTTNHVPITASITNTGDKRVRLKYSGKLTGNGVVSFGETFTIETNTPVKGNPHRLYLGTTVSLGTDASVAIDNLLTENSLELDEAVKNLNYTGNIVASVSNATITLSANAVGLSPNDYIYNQDGKFIGQIASISNANVVVNSMDGDGTYDMFFVPAAEDEIVTYSKKPFILNTNFTESTVFDALNFLAHKSGLEFTLVNEKIILQDINNYNSKRKFVLGYSEGNNLIEVESNESLFDAANRVVVIGDNVKATVDVSDEEDPIVLTYVDGNIKHATEAKVKAEQLLEIHNQPARKIVLKMQMKGFELMKPGDLITLNLKSHNIPADEYIVYEIGNAMAGITEVTVGTYNKTIAERLTEIHSNQKRESINVLTSNTVVELTTKVARDFANIKEQSLSYTITTPAGSVIGYSTNINYTNTLGGDETVETTELEV